MLTVFVIPAAPNIVIRDKLRNIAAIVRVAVSILDITTA